MATATATAVETGLTRKYYNDFLTYCEKTGTETNPAMFQKWDVEVNYSRIKELFGGNKAIYEAGLKALYTRVFYNCSLTYVSPDNGKTKVVISVNRRVETEDGGTRMAAISDMTEDEFSSVKAQIKARVKRDGIRLKYFSLPLEEAISLVTEAMEEAYAA